MALQPGEIVDGKYRIVRPIGQGGMGLVYEGENVRIKRRVAIKVLHAAVAAKEDVVQRFEREAQAAGRIGSAHIVEVLDLGSLPSGERFIVMEYLDGEDVTARILRLQRLTADQAAPILIQALEGLAAAHAAGIIHRDIKPDNIFILHRNAGIPDFVKLLDFGVSKFSALDAEMSMTRTGAVVGTPYYMSPEQAKGGIVDARTDLYALGVVAYQMVTGRVPFNAGSFNELLFKIVLESAEPLAQLVPTLDRDFKVLIERAMAREPDGRFQTASEFQAALLAWDRERRAPDPTATQEYPETFAPVLAARARLAEEPPPSGRAAPAHLAEEPPPSGRAPALAPQPRRGGLKLAVALVAGALVGAIGFGAYLVRHGLPETDAGPVSIPLSVATQAATPNEPAATATSAVTEAATPNAPVSKPAPRALTAVPPTVVPGGPLTPPPSATPQGGIGIRPTSAPTPAPTPTPTPTPAPTAGSTGRQFKTDL